MSKAAEKVSAAASSARSSISGSVDAAKNKISQSASNIKPPAVIPAGYKPDFLRGSNDRVPDAFTQSAESLSSDQENENTNNTIVFQPNLLDQYDTYTYHWKFFITPLSAARSGEVLELSRQTIIAESGVTELTIDNVEFQGIAVPSVEAGTGTQTLLKFQITEPGGAGLLDKMYYESISLGIGNWLVMPCFVQLEFRGRDPSSSDSLESGGPGALSQLKWVWPIKITNMRANVSKAGTIYSVDAIFYNELAQSNSYFSVHHNVVLSGLTNFGKAMDDLEYKLNADQYEKLLTNYSIPDTYRIVVDPQLKNIEIALPDAKKHTSRGSDFIDFDKKVATFNTGTSIDKIVDCLLGTSGYFQEKLQSSDTPTSEPDAANAADPMRKLWRVVTETKPIAYDYLRQDNAVEITIYIVEYDIGLIEATAAQTGQTADTRQAATKRLDTYKKKRILNKIYNYIFTGLNDQVINFDLNMNFSFAATLSRLGGIYYDTASSDRGVSWQDRQEQEKKVTEQIRETLRFVNNPDNSSKVEEKIAETQRSINASKIDDNLKQRYTTLLDKSRPATRSNFTREISNRGGLNVDGQLNRATINARSLANPPAQNNQLKFISDVNINSPAAREAKSIFDSNRKGKLRPIPFREGMQERDLAAGLDPTSDAARARTANVFSTALYSTLDASLQVVKLTIKGDPYWLFPKSVSADVKVLPYKSNMSDAAAIAEIKSTADRRSVNLYGTDNFVVIRFRTPKIYKDSTGLVEEYNDIETFSGVYRVIKITSKFEMGKFTQELECILDPLLNIADLPAFRASIETASSPPQTNSIIPQLPLASQKTDRLKNATDSVKGKASTIRNSVTGKVENVKSTAGKIPSAVSNIPTPSLNTITGGRVG